MEIDKVVEYCLSKGCRRPTVAIILGSGLATLSDSIRDQKVIKYEELEKFGFPQVSVEGHKGELVFGVVGSTRVVGMRGRFHTYEGYSAKESASPVYVLNALGATTLIVSNAAGGLNPDYKVGDVVIISDHIGMPTLTGMNPLRGPNDAEIGARFPPMSDAYDVELRNLAADVAKSLAFSGFVRTRGVYYMASGPSYETNAEARMIRNFGADMVGMSTVPEVICARHCGMRVLGLSLISNVLEVATGPSVVASHEEVLEATATRVDDLKLFVCEIVDKLDDDSYLESLIDDAASFRFRTSATPRNAVAASPFAAPFAAAPSPRTMRKGKTQFSRSKVPSSPNSKRPVSSQHLIAKLQALDVEALTPLDALEELTRCCQLARRV